MCASVKMAILRLIYDVLKSTEMSHENYAKLAIISVFQRFKITQGEITLLNNNGVGISSLK